MTLCYHSSRENVRVLGFGWFILPIFCGAYVELQTDHLQVISAIRQLRIYCAGVWHNCVSALLAVGCWWLFPYVFLLLYDTNKGAVVSEVFKVSLQNFQKLYTHASESICTTVVDTHYCGGMFCVL